MVIFETVLSVIFWCLIVGGVTFIIMCGLALLKNNATRKAHYIIANAIFAYQMDRIEKEYMCGTPTVDEVEYSDMEDYEKTFKRFYDWGYTRILPKDKFEIIKQFIEKE